MKTDTTKIAEEKPPHTFIISDLHLCEEEPVNLKFPLWKKYKTRQFFFDEEFQTFLNEIQKVAEGKPVELILNGDIFDFDSVTSVPIDPPYFISWLETKRGLRPQSEKSEYKIEKILNDHRVWVRALSDFLLKGHKAIFVIGNHDLELHYPKVQRKIIDLLNLPLGLQKNIVFAEFFYISNQDTLVEHGNQYDPYCMCQDPVSPFVQKYNRVEIRVPFGNLTTRYLINGMGFFNPHLESNFIMSPKQYVAFFWKYMLRAQPLLMLSWLWGSVVILVQSFIDRLLPNISDPITIEDRVEEVAKRANSTPKAVRQMRELAVAPAASYPSLIMKELWLDRAALVFLTILILYMFFLQVDNLFNISIFWIFIPFFFFVPFFIFYTRSIRSAVREFKEPKEKILNTAGLITNTSRVVYGHTHTIRHEMIGAIEHLNCGTWSPAFLDVECEKPLGLKTYVWLYPDGANPRQAKLMQIKDGELTDVNIGGRMKSDRVKSEP
jgi:UDP-2,3-diacylglucosamine pyrophosphatase LpxH